MKREIPTLTEEDKMMHAMITIACDKQLEPGFQEFINLNWWDLIEKDEHEKSKEDSQKV